MLASLEAAPLVDDAFVYEPKYDGIRALVEVEPGRAPRGVRIWSRLGNDKTGQFPEIVAALDRFRVRLKAAVVLDGEIVALDPTGEPAGFQRLQGRIHVTRRGERDTVPGDQATAFVAFDVLRDGPEDLRPLPLVARRARLERILQHHGRGALRLSELVAGDARALHERVEKAGGEGLVAKRLQSVYRSGRRSADWRKIKLARIADFVVGGFTEPRGARPHFGALLLGVPAGDVLEYVGHTGAGFDDRELARLHAVMAARETGACPFRVRPRTNERPHWITTAPPIVVSVRFIELTDDQKLRAPVYLRQREDVRTAAAGRPAGRRAGGPRATSRPGPPAGLSDDLRRIWERLAEIESDGGRGTVNLARGLPLEVTHLAKVWWPRAGFTKGDVMRYHVAASPYLLPAVADRPLIMKRYPDGVHAKAFFQQRAPAQVPRGVRTAVLPSDRVVPRRLVGGSLVTLLFMTQIAAISQDPWFSRVRTPDFADHVAFDLDPMPGVSFAQVRDVARFIHDELERLGVPATPKTSGAEGLHVYVPLPPRTTYDTGRIFCEIVAATVVQRHPRLATVERAVHARGRRVYIDCLQNIRGKSLATAYSVRASEDAGVSAPLTWGEVHGTVDRGEFTLPTMLDRVRAVGDLWRPLRESKGADLTAVLRRA
jgi:bifunctional non-homologous end joining protein LigD